MNSPVSPPSRQTLASPSDNHTVTIEDLRKSMLDQEHFRKSMDAQKRLEAELRSVREQMSRELSSDVYVDSQVQYLRATFYYTKCRQDGKD